MAWAEDYRQNWIAETLRVFGFINREHFKRKFGTDAATSVYAVDECIFKKT